MAQHVNWSDMKLALTQGRIATPEDHQRIAAQRAERDKVKAARAQASAERQTITETLKGLQIGQRHLITRYKLTSQIGPLMQRLRVLHGLYFTCRMEPGRGVWAERINPPHADPASGDNPNADLL